MEMLLYEQSEPEVRQNTNPLASGEPVLLTEQNQHL